MVNLLMNLHNCRMFRIVFFCILLSLPLQVLGNDLFGFLLSQCDLKLGAPIDHTEGQLTIMLPNGKIESFPSDQLTGIAHYILPESAFDLSNVSEDSLVFMKKFEVKDTDLIIKGFPYQFIDGTIFILDLKGSRRVVGQDELGRVNSATLDGVIKGSAKKLPKFSLPSGVSECKENIGGQLPVRFLADKIQVLETVNSWEKGFRDLNDLAERSAFYPRPFLFDRYDRFGFIFFRGDDPEINLLPFRYSFSNGHDFRFQGQTSFGGGFDTIGPRALPMNILATDLKFHFLHASFEGNITAMGVGSSFYAKESKFDEYSEKHSKEARGDVIFNHLALIGFDWSSWGLSFGPMFPTFYVQAGKESREAKPQKSVPVLRLTWTGEQLKFKVSGATGTLNATNNVTKKSTVIFGDAGRDSSADSYKMNFKYLRSGVEWDFNNDTKLSSDIIWTKWDYKESLAGNSLTFESVQTSVVGSIRKNFSQYVSLGLFLLWMKPEEKGKYISENFTRNESNMNFGGTFDFLF
jgi:hypothetical protein